MIGRRVEVTPDLTRVRALCDGRLVADHERIWAKHQTITDRQHLAAAKALRQQRLQLLRPPVQPEVEPQVEVRCLADYDTALGVDDGGAA